MERRNAWFEYTEAEEKELEKVNASYREFLNNGKTERECVKEIIRQAEAAVKAALGEGIAADLRERIRKDQIAPQPLAAVERTASERLQALRQRKRSRESGALGKRLVADAFQRCREGDLRQRVAILKGIVSDGGQAVRQMD